MMPDRRNDLITDRRATPRIAVDTGEIRERRGRPARNEEPTTAYAIRFTKAERAVIKKAARVNGQKPSEFARDAIVTAAEDCLDPMA